MIKINTKEIVFTESCLKRAAEEGGYAIELYGNGSFELESLERDASRHIVLSSFNCESPADYAYRTAALCGENETSCGDEKLSSFIRLLYANINGETNERR